MSSESRKSHGMIRIVTALVGTVALGILSRKAHTGAFLLDKSLGDVLYAIAAYLAIVFLTRWPWRKASIAAFLVAACVETFKLTGLPKAWSDFWLSRWVLGSVFSWHNFVCYACGALLIGLIDAKALRPDDQGRNRVP